MQTIKLPKEIETPQQFIDWIKQYKDDPSTDIEFRLKRSGYYGYAFSEHKGKLHYLKSDGYGTGLLSVKSINRVFEIRVY